MFVQNLKIWVKLIINDLKLVLKMHGPREFWSLKVEFEWLLIKLCEKYPFYFISGDIGL